MSTLKFRNLEVDPMAPVEQWPHEAVQAALERGSLEDWRRMAAAIQTDPWGPFVRRLEDVLRYCRPYGVAPLMERMLILVREQTEAEERSEVAAEVTSLLRQSGLTQAEFATRIGTSASRLSTYATGKVTPSAALLLRMRRVSEQQ